MRALGNVEYLFVAITPRSTLTRWGSACYGTIYRSNGCIKIIVLDSWIISSILVSKQMIKQVSEWEL